MISVPEAPDNVPAQAPMDSARLIAKVFEVISDGVLVSDARHHVVLANRAITELFGCSASVLSGRHISTLPFGHSWPDCGCGEAPVVTEVELRHHDGHHFPCAVTLTCVFNEQGVHTHHVWVIRDISTSKALHERLEQDANHDALTGLPNRRLFQDRLEHALERAKRDDQAVALLFIDLDNLKAVNDRHGHQVGDLLLREVARRLREATRTSDSVCRLGGDEFTVIIEGGHLPDDALAAAERIVLALGSSYILDGETVSSSVSIGVALYPDASKDATGLVECADFAMYAAKRGGRNGYRTSPAHSQVANLNN